MASLMSCVAVNEDKSDSLDDGDLDAGTDSEGQSYSNEVVATPEQGAQLTLEAHNGDRITLSIPAGALEEETTITVISLGTVPSSPVQDGSFALRLEPHGLVFNTPAELTIEHAQPFAEADDMTLFWVVSEEQFLAMTTDPITSTTEVSLSHFSDYVGAPADGNLDAFCMEANWLDGQARCIDNLPMVWTLMKCAARTAQTGGSSEEQWDYINAASGLMLQTFRKLRSREVPTDDYCHRDGSQSGQYIQDLYPCLLSSKTGQYAFLDENHADEMNQGIADAATELAQAWLDSDPPMGDSCYKLGEVEEWMDYASCLVASPLHQLDDQSLFSNHLLEGQVTVQGEFVGSPAPSAHAELCGWYLECLERHLVDLPLTRVLSGEAEATAQAIEERYSETEAQCENLWDVSVVLDITKEYEFSGMYSYTADFTITVEYEDISIEAESSSMQTAARSVDELGGIAPGEVDADGSTLLAPFFTNLASGGQFIQMSFMLDLDQAKKWDVQDNGSSYNCIMDYACSSISDFEVRPFDAANHPGTPSSVLPDPSGQLMIMRTRASQDLSWAGQVLPQNTGYLIWRYETLVDICEYDSDDGEWDCETPTLGTVAEPRPGDEDVVSEPLAPEYYFFNARLSAQQVKNFLDRKAFSYSYTLSNHLDINSGAVLEDQSQTVTVELTPKN